MERRKLLFRRLMFFVALFSLVAVNAQVSMTGTGSYSQNFNTLATSGTNNSFTNNATLPGWYLARERNSGINYAASNGGSAGAGFFSFGTGVNSDRALGSMAPDDITGDVAYGLLLRNNTSNPIINITVSYTMEQWRKGQSVSDQDFRFHYRIHASNANESTRTNLSPNSNSNWTSVSALNADAPITSGTTRALDGNATANRIVRSNVPLGATLQPGEYIMLRWRHLEEHDDYSHGLSIDDVTVNYEEVSYLVRNEITTNGNTANPYTTGMIVATNASSTGIGRGSGLSNLNVNGAYSASGFETSSSINLNDNDYFEFTITPAVGYALNFQHFEYEGQRGHNNGPEDFSFRSSLNYNSSIANYSYDNTSAHNRTISLSASQYQNVTSAITFRLYGWDAGGGNAANRRYQVNRYGFAGTVSMIPPAVTNTVPTVFCDNAPGVSVITGNNLIHVTTVTVGGTPVTINSKTNTQIQITIPQGVSGQVVVTNEAGSANGAVITLNQAVTYYADLDGDGFGDANNTITSCSGVPAGYVANSDDCDDNLVMYQDLDNDGFGSSVMVACGGVTNSDDCDDTVIMYEDLDGDGYGTSVIVACGGALVSGDCNDSDAAINPGAADVCYDGIDNDCNGVIDNDCVPIITVVQPSQCGITLNASNDYIYANLVAGAQGYRFRVEDMVTGQVQYQDRVLRNLRITELTNYAFDREYKVSVSVRIGGVWQPFYGDECTVRTPIPYTQIQASQCEIRINNMTDILYANLVPFATGYRFRVTDPMNPEGSQEFNRAIRDFRMHLFEGVEFDKTYMVEVAVRNTDGSYLPYGPACSITTPFFPSTSLQESQCDSYMPSSLTEYLYADAYPGVTKYRFELTNDSGYFQYVDRVLRNVRLSDFNALASLVPDSTYTMRVKIEINGVLGPIGKPCTVVVPGGSGVNYTKSDTDVFGFAVVASPNPFVDGFNLDVRSNSTSSVSVAVYDMTGRLLESRDIKVEDLSSQTIGHRYPSGVYNVVVTQDDEVRTVRVVRQ